MWVRTLVVCLTTLGLGCASAPRKPDRVGIPLDELLRGAPLARVKHTAAPIDESEILAVSPEMRDFLHAHVTTAGGAARLRQLGHAIIHDPTFKLVYDETTRTAAETFRARRGNCLSFSSMFVAMARHLGLDARFQEVDIPPDWSYRNDVFVLNRHVDVFVDLGMEGERVVDFNMDDFRTSYDRRVISDARARAHFYNNVAVERMQAGDAASALLYFRKSVDNDPLFSSAWTNLGILYLREGHADYAEAAYRQALRADKGDLVAMSNLASLYEQRGDEERAARYRDRVRDHRQRNPYYRFQLAREAFLAHHYDTAIGHLKYAVSQKRNEDQFCFLLGLSYMRKGDEEAARRWMSRAEELAATDAQKRRYSSKMDLLLAGPRDENAPR
jgi:Flp pilus assembly protein TadD